MLTNNKRNKTKRACIFVALRYRVSTSIDTYISTGNGIPKEREVNMSREVCELKGIHICGYRCNERQKSKTEGSKRLAYDMVKTQGITNIFRGKLLVWRNTIHDTYGYLSISQS
jgi:hypothetical protein